MTDNGSAVPFIFKRIVQVTSKSHSFFLAVHKGWVMGFKANLPKHYQCRILLQSHEWASLSSASSCDAFRGYPCRSQGSLAGPAPQPRWFSCHSLPQSRIILRSYPDLGSLVRCLTAVEELQLYESNSELYKHNFAPNLIQASKVPWA